MKRRFPILLKVIILGIGVSILTAGAAITVNYFNQKNMMTDSLIDNIDNTLDEASTIFMTTSSEDSEDYTREIRIVNDYMAPIFDGLTPEQKTTIDDYPSFKEFAEHYEGLYPWIYSKGIGLGMSEPQSRFRLAYFDLLNLLTNFKLSSGSESVYLSFNVDTDSLGADSKTMVFMMDSRMANLDGQYTTYYLVAGSFYNIKKSDYIEELKFPRHATFVQNGNPARFINIYDYFTDPNNPSLIASLYIEYDLADIETQLQEVLQTELLILGLSSLALIAIYTIFSYLFFVKNINKLSKVSSDIRQRLIDKNMTEVIDIPMKSNDEIKDLAESLTEMEKAIINYVDIINKEAQNKERTNAELAVASKIQLDSLPVGTFEDKNVSLKAYIKTAKEVGGDFYDYFYLDSHRLVVLISDVSGKGIPASLFMMKGKELIKSALQSYTSLVEAINSVNNMLVKNNTELLFITSFIGVIDFDKNEIRYINAGQEKPYIVSNKKIHKLEGESNIVLGVEENFEFKQEIHEFNKGDYIFMFTDGLNESINSENEEFGYQRVEEALENTNSLRLEEVINKINNMHDAFTDSKEQFDDITMLLVKNKENNLKLHYEKKEYEIISDIVDQFNDFYSFLSDKVKAPVGIIIDELVNNLISYEKREDLVIDVEFKLLKEGLKMNITSNGDDYDPFVNHQEKYLEEYHSEIKEGGFGLSIIKDLSKSYSYKYKNGHSIVEIIVAL